MSELESNLLQKNGSRKRFERNDYVPCIDKLANPGVVQRRQNTSQTHIPIFGFDEQLNYFAHALKITKACRKRRHTSSEKDRLGDWSQMIFFNQGMLLLG